MLFGEDREALRAGVSQQADDEYYQSVRNATPKAWRKFFDMADIPFDQINTLAPAVDDFSFGRYYSKRNEVVPPREDRIEIYREPINKWNQERAEAILREKAYADERRQAGAPPGIIERFADEESPEEALAHELVHSSLSKFDLRLSDHHSIMLGQYNKGDFGKGPADTDPSPEDLKRFWEQFRAADPLNPPPTKSFLEMFDSPLPPPPEVFPNFQMEDSGSQSSPIGAQVTVPRRADPMGYSGASRETEGYRDQEDYGSGSRYDPDDDDYDWE
jgi:hypothetical protein